ncbi:MAG: hypothetical protein WKF30_15995 [Pyrinomonadaceae bacterium]
MKITSSTVFLALLVCAEFGSAALAQSQASGVASAQAANAPQGSALRLQFEAIAVVSSELNQYFNTSAVAQASSLIPFTFVLNNGDVAAMRRLRTRDALRTVWQQDIATVTDDLTELLLGGEFPVPVMTSNHIARKSAATVQFKEYGVSLKLRVVAAGDGKLAIEVTPEVSTVNLARQIRFADYVIPALDSRRTTKRMVIAPGKTIAIVNLLSQHELAALARVGFQADRRTVFAELNKFSRDANQQVELMLLVTLLSPVPQQNATNPDALTRPQSGDLPTGIIGESGFATSTEHSKLP